MSEEKSIQQPDCTLEEIGRFLKFIHARATNQQIIVNEMDYMKDNGERIINGIMQVFKNATVTRVQHDDLIVNHMNDIPHIPTPMPEIKVEPQPLETRELHQPEELNIIDAKKSGRPDGRQCQYRIYDDETKGLEYERLIGDIEMYFSMTFWFARQYYSSLHPHPGTSEKYIIQNEYRIRREIVGLLTKDLERPKNKIMSAEEAILIGSEKKKFVVND